MLFLDSPSDQLWCSGQWWLPGGDKHDRCKLSSGQHFTGKCEKPSVLRHDHVDQLIVLLKNLRQARAHMKVFTVCGENGCLCNTMLCRIWLSDMKSVSLNEAFLFWAVSYENAGLQFRRIKETCTENNWVRGQTDDWNKCNNPQCLQTLLRGLRGGGGVSQSYCEWRMHFLWKHLEVIVVGFFPIRFES